MKLFEMAAALLIFIFARLIQTSSPMRYFPVEGSKCNGGL